MNSPPPNFPHDPREPRNITPLGASPPSLWPLWRKVLAYAVLAGVSLAAICYVDRKVHIPSAMPEKPTAR